MPLANVSLSNTFDEWRVRTNQLVIVFNGLEVSVPAAYNTANLAYQQANTVSNLAIVVSSVSNSVNTNSVVANSAFGRANIAYTQANTALNVAVSAYEAANSGTFAASAFNQANTARNQANTALSIAIPAFDQANSAFNKANTAGGGYFRGNNGDKGVVSNKFDLFRINAPNVSSNLTFTNGENALAVGPLVTDPNVTITIQPGARVVII